MAISSLILSFDLYQLAIVNHSQKKSNREFLIVPIREPGTEPKIHLKSCTTQIGVMKSHTNLHPNVYHPFVQQIYALYAAILVSK